MKSFLSQWKISMPALEYIWLVYGLLFGMFLVFFLPPLQVMDEHQHFQKAYGITEGYVMCTRSPQNKPGIYAPSNILNASQVLGVGDVPYNSTIQVSERNMETRGKIKVGNDEVFIQHPFCETPAWSSIPAAIGVGVARVFDMPVLTLIHWGRLSNLFVAVTLIFFAIKIAPVGKRFFFITAALPMFMQQISSLSLDAFHYSSLFLFVAWILRLAYQEKSLGIKQIVWFSLFSILALHAKFGFVFAGILIFLLPWKAFATKKQYGLSTGLFLGVHFLLFVGLRTLLSVSDLANQGAINREEQVLYALTHPFDFIYAVINSVGMYFDFYWKNMLGILGWTDASMLTLHFVLLIFVLAVVLTVKSDEHVSLKNRGVLFITWGATMLAIFGALYAISTPVGDNYVHLVQGKYFLPVFPLLLLAISNIRISPAVQKVLLSLFLIINVAFVYVALDKRYYASYDLPADTFQTVQKWIEVDGKGIVKSSFTSNSDNLQGVSIYMKRGTIPQGIYRFALRDASCSRILVSKEIRTAFIPEEGYVDILFDLQRNSNGKEYCWTIDPDQRVVEQPLSLAISGSIASGTGTTLSGASNQFVLRTIHKK